ncbi:hypothetical protein [Thermogymnomonas acidicola]|uniref:hypothetical protein n=1 Tax=Thermogymnomonas acidicola TaxID=399579 RepID=UPI001396BADF|nr:hypothetical protein [Thermogymnomonas acidicola]
MSIVAGMTIFSFSLYPLLSYFGIPIEYAALGLSIGQFAVIFTAMLTGRLIDAGHSYRLLTIGSFFYPAVFFAITLSAWRGPDPAGGRARGVLPHSDRAECLPGFTELVHRQGRQEQQRRCQLFPRLYAGGRRGALLRSPS